jgi:penicillin-binding protein 1A
MTPPSLLRVVALTAAAALAATACRLPELPSLAEARAQAQTLPQTSFIYAADGTLITSLHAEQDRILIGSARIPRAMKDAVVAIEDRRFWTHRGVDVRAILRAARANAAEGEIVQGGSTITQQYVKNTITGTERTVDRKLREAFLALQVEKEMSKEEILGAYLNTVYFGQGAYGLRSAAKELFRKRVIDLTLAESALLAGMIASPGSYDPVDNPEAALARRNLVLERMHEEESIDASELLEARTQPLGLRLAREKRRYPAAYFIEYVKRQILSDQRFGRTYTQRYNFLFAGGLRIYTTIDLDLQAAAEEAVNGVLSQPDDPSGAMTVIDPRTGHIKAMVGGRDFFAQPRDDRHAKLNLATGGSTGRQAGSSFKPFALVTALEQGLSPETRYAGGSSIALSDPVCRNSPTDPWVVSNYEGSAYGSLTLEEATVRSVNVVYAQVIRDVDPRRVVETAKRMGVASRLRPLCSAVLGANEVNTLEMASAYGTLATLGTRVRPVAIERIEDAGGGVLFEANPAEDLVVSPGVAWQTTEILQEVVDRGTGVAARLPDRPVAGKTGTAQLWRDAWFVGYIPQLVAAVWVGFPEGQISMVPPRTRIRVTGGSFPAQIWRSFMLAATEGMPVEEWAKPEAGFVTVAVDVTRNCVANEHTPEENIEVLEYVAGAQPRTPCPLLAQPEAGAVPSVVGMGVDAATDVLEGAGFAVSRTTAFDPAYEVGTVIGQSPAAGTEAGPGTRVEIVVATDAPPIEQVPGVLGMTQPKATDALEDAGFAVSILIAPAFDKKVKPGSVLAQTPGGGQERPLGSTVTITVNPGPPASSPAPSPSP